MWELPDDGAARQWVLDYARPMVRRGKGPSGGSVVLAWLLPVGMQAFVWLGMVSGKTPFRDGTAEDRWCNFFRSIIGPIELGLGQMKIYHGTGLELHGAMAVGMWTAVLVVATMTPVRRMPWVVHLGLSLAICFGGCCLIVVDSGY